jgi:hypothetical protein
MHSHPLRGGFTHLSTASVWKMMTLGKMRWILKTARIQMTEIPSADPFPTDYLVGVTIIHKGTLQRCCTIARSYEEAVQRVRMRYSIPQSAQRNWTSSYVDGWRRLYPLPLTGKICGVGHFLRSSRDQDHRHSLMLINSVR